MLLVRRDRKCRVEGCDESVIARRGGRCTFHDGSVIVCICARPRPDGLGECQDCHRLVPRIAP